MKLSRWFSPSIKPVRVGIYMTMTPPNAVHDRGVWFQYWTGTYWKVRSDTVLGAMALKEFKSGHQDVYWRGIER